jgi:hypothetical protein
MRVLYSKFCEYACQLMNGRHSLIGIFDNVRAPEFPVDHPPFFICVEIEFEPLESGKDRTFRFALIDEDGKEILGFEGPPATVPKDPQYGPLKMQITVGVGGIRFEKAGVYRLDVSCDGEVIAEERLPVVQV